MTRKSYQIIHSAADYGYTTQPPARRVCIGDTFRSKCALGIYESRVLRPAYRNAGYYETVFERWITEVPAFRQGFVGSIEILSGAEILAAIYAD